MLQHFVTSLENALAPICALQGNLSSPADSTRCSLLTRDCRAVLQELDRTRASAPNTCVVIGAAGLGKSTLLNQIVRKLMLPCPPTQTSPDQESFPESSQATVTTDHLYITPPLPASEFKFDSLYDSSMPLPTLCEYRRGIDPNVWDDFEEDNGMLPTSENGHCTQASITITPVKGAHNFQIRLHIKSPQHVAKVVCAAREIYATSLASQLSDADSTSESTGDLSERDCM